MTGLKKKSNYEGTVAYTYRGGVDFTGEHKSDRLRPSYMENLYRDYEGSGGDMLESIPGFRILTNCNYKINGIYKSPIGLIIHSGTTLTVAKMKDGIIEEKVDVGILKDAKSRAFSVGKYVYVLDGNAITCIDESLTASVVGENGNNAYIPTTYYNGALYEQRNLLTDKFKEKILIPSPDDYSMGADGIYYRIIDYDAKKCAVTGTNDAFFGDYVSIPSFVTLNGERYSVVAIDDGAFKPGTVMRELHIAEGIGTIGKSAFAGCTDIEKIYFPKTLSEIGDGAFAGCSRLQEIYLWLGLERIGSGSFERCGNLGTVYYTGSESDFKKIQNYTALFEKIVPNHSGYYGIRMELPLSKEAKSINSVYIGDVGYAFTAVSSGSMIKSVIVSIYDKRTVVGKIASISGAYGEKSELADALMRCTVHEIYDGRVFLSGSRDMPGTVFFSATSDDGTPNMQYFGEYDTFKDGGGEASVKAILGAHDGVIVFCDDDVGGGIFYHSRIETGDGFIKTAYPVSYIHSGISTKGGAISFYDDPIFLTDSGVFGIDMKELNYDRSVSCRSTLINPRLLTENLDDAHLARWKGYLVVATGEHIYLGDSRGAYKGTLGKKEYEWYYLSGIGTRVGAENVYRYSSVARSGFDVHPDCDGVTDKTVMSVMMDGELYYFVSENQKSYAVHKTEEVRGGKFHPLTALCSSREGELIFGTSCGDVCIFNTDKRGTLPDFIKNLDDETEEFTNAYSRKIHPYYYSFANFAPTYAIKTPKDNCGSSNVLKSTEKHSLTFTCKAAAGRTVCEIGTDKSGYSESGYIPNSSIDFSYFDFKSLSFSTTERITVPMSEKEKGWIEKQIAIYSRDFAAPIGISEISYRFSVKGRIKKT